MQPRFARLDALLGPRLTPLLTFAALSVSGAALAMGALAACGSSNTVVSGTPAATSQPGDDAGGPTGGAEGGSATDAGTDGGGGHDGAAAEGGAAGSVDGPGVAGATCSFNHDCHLALRCECSESTGCACQPGARGTGKNGIDPCASGNDCASSVCIDGPPDAGSFCSDACMTAAQCTGVLPLCSDIAFVGRICIRTAPQ